MDFANKQSKLIVDAYEKKDVKTQEKLMTEFLTKYEKLNENDKKENVNYIVNAYYNIACTYALIKNKDKSLFYLKKSIEKGYTDYMHIQEDSDLNYIRHSNEFAKIAQQIKSVGDYLYILQRSEQYNINDNREIPPFTYQSEDTPELKALRKGFHLDSIAGEGNEISKILNLLHWIHNLISHDGSHANPEVQNAMDMISECKQNKRGLNCRGLAIVLNECYLSMGIKSRIVTCLPKDSLGIDPDCHVINTVWSKDLKKWLYIDPTFDAYVMNEKGELLSIEEVRYRIIHQLSLILNPDANWNKKNSQTKEYYLFQYMAKNLYMIECPIASKYNMEIKGENINHQYVKLLPVNDFRQEPSVKKHSDKKFSNSFWINYKTNNPTIFWKSPY